MSGKLRLSGGKKLSDGLADTLAGLVPGSGHLVHMPAHLYWRVGRYHDAAEANVRAAAVDEAYIAQCNAQGFYPALYYPHNIHFLWAAASMEGRTQMLRNTRLRAATIEFTVDIDGQTAALRGVVNGDRMQGRSAGGTEWSATRP